MNPNHQPQENLKHSARDIHRAQEVILTAIRKNQQCFWPEILKENSGKLSEDLLLVASRRLQKNKIIRLREDSLEHAMEYTFVKPKH